MKKLTDPALLAGYMEMRDITGARLGRKANITRQFVYQLLGGSRSRTSDERAERIELALGLIPGTIFVPDTPQTGARVSSAA